MWQLVMRGERAASELGRYVQWDRVEMRGSPPPAPRRRASVSVAPGYPLPARRLAVEGYVGVDQPKLELIGDHWRWGDTVEPMRDYIHQQVNEALRGHVHMAVVRAGPTEIRFYPDTLVAAVYAQFARALTSSALPEAVSRNRRCPQPAFIPDRPNKVYFSKQCREVDGYHRRKGQSPIIPPSTPTPAVSSGFLRTKVDESASG